MREGEMIGRGSNVIRLRSIVEGYVEASLVVVDDYISFLGDMDPKRGVLRKRGYEGVEVRGRILVFRGSRGSTVGPYILYSAWKEGNAPSAMVVTKADQIVISGCVISNIPLGEIVGRDIAELRNYSGRKALIKLGPEEGFLMID
jgi:predicted aconitase with swiveling domain